MLVWNFTLTGIKKKEYEITPALGSKNPVKELLQLNLWNLYLSFLPESSSFISSACVPTAPVLYHAINF